MKKLLQRASYYFRGLIYYLFYDLRYRKTISREAKLEEQVVTVRVDDISYRLRVHVVEGGLAEDLYICSIREYPNVFFFKDYVASHAGTLQTYIGIGANIGYYAFLSRNVLKRSRSNTRIFALEPIKSTFNRFLSNIKLNNAADIKTLNIGIGDKDTEANMIVMKQRNLSKIQDGVNPAGGEVEKIEKIPLYTLSTLFSKYGIPKRDVFMRCDIEGYEYNLVVGNRDFLKKLKNAYLVMEFHPFYLHADKSIELLRTLKSIGFTLDQVVSCEPLYFVMMPKIIRRLLIRLFLFQYEGEALGKIKRFRTIDDLIRDLRNEDNVLYHYANLHFYFSKK